LCVEKYQQFLINFGALSLNLFLNFCQHVRYLEIILNSYSRNTENAHFEWLGKQTTRYFRNQSTRGSFGFESCFQNCFWNVFSTSGLSQICKKRNVWKLSSPFSRNTLIPCSEKPSWSLKTLFWKKSYPTN
jgi:hypothetical protein